MSKRQLTQAELLRKERFDADKARLEADGYRAADLTIGPVYANMMALVLSLPIVILLNIVFRLNHAGAAYQLEGLGLLLFPVVFFILIPVHEVIHGVTWALFAKEHWKAISFGFIAKYLMPYCTCREALRKGPYMLGVVMPTLLLGLLPCLVAIWTGSIALFYMSALQILMGGGDLAILLKLLRYRSDARELILMDHPYEAGLVIFTK